MAEYKFINPYNFIPLGNNCRKTPYQKGTYTGYIECVLETKTPLIMIDSSSNKEIKLEGGDIHVSYPKTFMIGNQPAIPGSELRGMIRNVFETVTQSCLVNTDPKIKFSGRYVGNMFQPGLLVYKNGQCSLYKCDKYSVENPYVINDLKKYKAGDLIRFNDGVNRKKSKIVKSIGSGKLEGYLRKGEPLGNKIFHHIFVNTGEKVETGDIDLTALYQEACDKYYENLERKHVNQCDGDYRPVWYEQVQERVYLSLGQNGQTNFYRQFGKMYPENFDGCKDENNVCETCQVFGTINEKFVLPSLVRFTDALLDNQQTSYYMFEKPITLEELSSPKSDNPYFYMLLKENGELVDYSTNFLWNVDFKSKFSKKMITQLLKDDEVQIRGRKFYWHFQPKLNQKVRKTKRNVSVKPLKTGLKYNFKVYFNDLTQEQLEHLNMSLCLDNNSNYCHKLGMGKPLGFGSVKIKTTNIVCRNIHVDNSIHYEVKPYQCTMTSIDDLLKDMNDAQYYAFISLFDFDYIKLNNVSYPRNEEDGDIFEWFESNKKSREKKVLPFAEKEYDDLIQKVYVSRKNAPKNNYRNKR